MTHNPRPENAVQVPVHVQSMEAMLRIARLADALSTADHKLCWAIKNSRDCGLSDLEQGLVALQKQFDALVARLQPAVAFELNRPV